ncbi:MAG: DUF4115 domain-containing protein [Clostridia bacterium]|nr:DUF4115 domain-containing protein [Clostridia bacterium]
MEIGKSLREAREAKHLSLSEAEEKLKIRSRYLEALENEDFTVLPEKVYARGFLRSYAQFLGLDAELLLQEFEALKAEEAPEEESKASPSYEQSFAVPNKKTWIKIIVGALVLVIIIWWIIAGLGISKQEKDAALPPPETTKTTETNPEPTVPETPPTPTYDGLELTLTASGYDCWILVTADGQQVLETILTNGSSESFKAQNSIKVQAGYGLALQVTLNGQDLGTFSQTDVASREFTLNDLNQ